MSYNLKCCSFYPNNFDASALDLGRGTHVPRSGYTCTSVGVRMYFGRGTMTIWFISENKRVHLMEQKSHGLHTTIVECSPWFLFIKEQRLSLKSGYARTAIT